MHSYSFLSVSMVKYCGKLHQPTGGIQNEIVRFCYKKNARRRQGAGAGNSNPRLFTICFCKLFVEAGRIELPSE
tara:strand:+ start:577 stop:798 length:222 start_codon:yes stop_codon:yes gene_type:complete